MLIGISAIGVPFMILTVAGQWWQSSDQQHTRHVLVAAGLAFLTGMALNQLILLFVHRVRPYDGGITHLLIAPSADFSFPSDHATASFAIAATFMFHGMRRRGCQLSWLQLCWWLSSRVYVGIHYASDVMGAALTGIVAAALIPSVYWEDTRADRFVTGIL